MRFIPCLIVALGTLGAVGTTAMTAQAQQEAQRHLQEGAAAQRESAVPPDPMKVTVVPG